MVDGKQGTHPTFEVLKDGCAAAFGHIQDEYWQGQMFGYDFWSFRIHLMAFCGKYAIMFDSFPRHGFRHFVFVVVIVVVDE